MKIAFIGAGRIAESHLRSIERLRDRFSITFAGCYNPHPEKAERLNRLWGDGKSFGSVDALLDEPGLDAIYVLSPTPFHYEQALAVVERGYALYLEKPLALDYPSVVELHKRIEESGIVHCVGLHWRYRDLVQVIRSYTNSSRPPALLTTRWFWHTPTVSWLRNRNTCGGQVFDQLIHVVDLYRYLAGDVAAVSALYREGKSTVYPDFDNWDVHSLQFRFNNGAFGTIDATYKLNIPLEERVWIEVVGDNLLCRLTAAKLEVYTEKQCTTFLEGGETALDMVGGREAIEGAFFTAVQNKDQSKIITTISETAETMKVLFAANRSAKIGKPVNPADISKG